MAKYKTNKVDERKDDDPTGVAFKAGINEPDQWGPPTPFGREATRNSLARGIKAARKLKRAGEDPNDPKHSDYLAHQVHTGWAKAAQNSPHQSPEQQVRRAKLINPTFDDFMKNLSPEERAKDTLFVKKATRAANRTGEFADTPTAKNTGASPMEEQYTAEQWLGMMKEVGYSLKEGNPQTKQKKNAAMLARATDDDREYMRSLYINRNTNMSPEEYRKAQLMQSIRNNAKYKNPDPLSSRSPNNYGGVVKNNPSLSTAYDVMKKPGMGQGVVDLAKNLIVKPEFKSMYPKSNIPEPTNTGDTPMEKYTAEQWMGMMAEAGVNLNELSPAEIEAQKNSPEAKAKAAERGSNFGFGPNERPSEVGYKLRRHAHRQWMEKNPVDSPERLSQDGINPQKYLKHQLQLKQVGHGKLPLPEQFTLEEWMGMMTEAGFNLNELRSTTYGNAADKLYRKAIDAAGAARRVAPEPHNQGDEESHRHAQIRLRARANANARELYSREAKLRRAQGAAAARERDAENAATMARTAPTPQPADSTNESHTLEEWMGMMNEFGYALQEGPVKDTNKKPTMKNIAKKRTGNKMADRLRDENPSPEMADRLRDENPSPDSVRNRPPFGEQYTLEEWMSMMNEAGYSLEEVSQANIMGGWQGIAPNAPGANRHTEMGLAAQGNAEPTTGEEDEEKMEEQFTLEEWMGMMTEAGFNVDEGFMDSLRKGATSVGKAVTTGLEKVGLKKTQAQKDAEEVKRHDAYRAYRDTIHAAGQRIADKARSGGQPKNESGLVGKQVKLDANDNGEIDSQDFKILRGKKEKTPVSENTVARLQELAGVKPLNG